MTASDFQKLYGHRHPPEARLRPTEPSQQTAALGEGDAGKAQGSGRPLVRITLRRVALFDTDAKWGAVKDLLDGCIYAGLLQGDREDQISLEVIQEKVDHRYEEETFIHLTLP